MLERELTEAWLDDLRLHYLILGDPWSLDVTKAIDELKRVNAWNYQIQRDSEELRKQNAKMIQKLHEVEEAIDEYSKRRQIDE